MKRRHSAAKMHAAVRRGHGGPGGKHVKQLRNVGVPNLSGIIYVQPGTNTPAQPNTFIGI